MDLRNQGARVRGILLAPGNSTGQSAARHKNHLGQEATVLGKTIQQVQDEHTDEWVAIPGVAGTAIAECEGKPCILVLIASHTERVRRKIPPTVDGYPVVVQYVGAVRALDKQ